MTEPVPYALPLVRLLKGPIYADSGEAWALLLRHRPQVEDWFGQIGLELVVAEHDGLAFVRRRRDAGEATAAPPDSPAAGPVPELIVRRELPYLASLLCVLLVQELYRFETGSSDEARLVLDRAKIRELALPFLPRKTNEARQADALDAQINKLENYGFLRRIAPNSEEFEVMKLLKHKIDAAAISEALAKLGSCPGGKSAGREAEDE
jgi:hypothetical protein